MAADLTTMANILKNYYLPDIRDQLNNDMILSKRISRNTEAVSGKNVTIAVRKGRSKGVGARLDGGTLPVADNQKYTTVIIPTRYNYGRIKVTGPTMAASKTEKGAYIAALDAEIDGMVQGLKKNINRQYWGCGYGIIGIWATGAAATHTIAKNYLAITDSPGCFGSTFGAKYLYADASTPFGTQVNVYAMTSAGDTVTMDAITTTALASQVNVKTIVTSVATYDTVTFGANPSVTEAKGSFYTIFESGPGATGGGALTTGANRREMMGLRGIVTDTEIDTIITDGATPGLTTTDSLQNLAITNAFWKAQVHAHAGGRYTGQRALTLDVMQQAFDSPWEVAGLSPDLILTTTSLRRKYVDVAVADRRIVNTMKLDGGFDAVEFNGKPMVVDTDAIDGEMYFINESHLSRYMMGDFDWMDKHGAILFPVSGQDAYEAVLYVYGEFGTDQRNAHSVLVDLAYNKGNY